MRIALACAAAVVLLAAAGFVTYRARQGPAPAKRVGAAGGSSDKPVPAHTAPRPPVIPESRLAAELKTVRAEIDGVRKSGRDAVVQAAWIEQAVAARGGVFIELFAADATAADRLLTFILEEKERDVRLALARLLRAAPHLRVQLLGLEDRDVAVAALGSAEDASAHDVLSTAACSAASESTRLLAIESIASDPARYDAWRGRPHAEDTLRRVLSTDATPRVRAAAVEAYSRVAAEGPERAAYLRGRLRVETDDSVREAISSVIGDTKDE